MSDSYLIVGVGYPTTDLFDIKRRMHDDTPRWKNEETATVMHVSVAATGGAEEFSRFIREILDPEIARRYRVDLKQRTLFGHSLGGLFALVDASLHPTDFEHFFAASPSLWWNDGLTTDDIQTQLTATAKKDTLPDIYTSVGSEEEQSNPSTAVRRARESIARMVTRNKSFSKHLQILRKGANHFWLVPHAGHLGSVGFAATQALRLAFPGPDDTETQ